MTDLLDTPKEIRKIQNQIFFQKTVQERFQLGIEMIEDAKKIVENSIRIKNPQISAIDLKIEVFKRFYKNDFSEEKKEDIIKGFREYYSKLVS
jgi:hypothetical protein